MLAVQEKDLTNIIGEIVSLHQRIERTIRALRTRFNEADKLIDDSNRYGSPSYWRLVGITDGMMKVRNIIEQNFQYIETLGTLATTRYMLELLIWFRLLNSSAEHSFIYARWVITGNRDYLKEHLAKVKNEIIFFEELEKREVDETMDAATRSLDRPKSDHELSSTISARFSMISEEIDRQARRRFCLYGRDAKSRGYGFQAALLKKQIIPQLENEITRLHKIHQAALAQMPKSAQVSKRWNWKEQAAKAGMSEQYDFLYSYTSRLLHATPASLTTKQKNLELDEGLMFLEFIFVAILEATEIAEGVGKIERLAAH